MFIFFLFWEDSLNIKLQLPGFIHAQINTEECLFADLHDRRNQLLQHLNNFKLNSRCNHAVFPNVACTLEQTWRVRFVSSPCRIWLRTRDLNIQVLFLFCTHAVFFFCLSHFLSFQMPLILPLSVSRLVCSSCDYLSLPVFSDCSFAGSLRDCSARLWTALLCTSVFFEQRYLCILLCWCHAIEPLQGGCHKGSQKALVLGIYCGVV